MLKKSCYVFAFCFLGVLTHAEKTLARATTVENVKVVPQNVSALYIGDLLRTKTKEVLDEAASHHEPVIASHGYQSKSRSSSIPATSRSFNYKAHGGHEYAKNEYSRPSYEHRNNNPIPQSTSARAAPVLGHLITVKPVRVLPSDNLRHSRHGDSYQTAHHENDDCIKSLDHSDEDRSYVPEEKSYRREKQIDSESATHYRNPHSSYEDDRSDEYSSHSETPNGNSKSNTTPSKANSKSVSSGSYTQSKSVSTSRTITPARPKQPVLIVPKKYSRDLEGGTSHHKNQEHLVYKAQEPPIRDEQSSYPTNPGGEYPPSNYETSEKHGISPGLYSPYPKEVIKPNTHSNKEKITYSTPVKESERFHQYGPYEQEDSYEQTTYSPTRELGYREHNEPTDNYNHGQEYTSRPYVKDQEKLPITPYQNSQNPESGGRYKKIPKKVFIVKKQRNPLYSPRVVNEEREYDSYKKRQQSPETYSYQIEGHRQVPITENPREHYESYSPHDQTKSYPRSTSFQPLHPTLKTPETKENHPYIYEQQEKNNQHNARSQKIHHRESPRYIRSPEKHLRPVEERNSLLARENKPLVMMSRSKPYVSHSVSYSKSGSGENFRQEDEATDGRQNRHFDMQNPTAYKPYNSEYPASYANDPHYMSGGSQSHSIQPQSYEQPSSYEESPSQYQPYDKEQQSYEENGPQENSYAEDGDAPGKQNNGHHYISKVEGYRDTYSSSVPLHLDDAFFEKYGISKTAKIIVAEAVEPNLLVADGTNIPYGGHNEEADGPAEGHHSSPEDEERFEQPNYKEQDSNDDNESPEELGVPKQLPGSFDDLVNTNPKFLRKLPLIMNPGDSFFKTDEEDIDELDFHNVEHKGFVVSQGPREIVQQHGDGVSRIIFNIPKRENVAEDDEEIRRNDDEKLVSAATTLIKDILSDS